MLTQDLMIPGSIDIDGVAVTYYDSEDTRNHPDDVLVMVHGTSGSTASHFGFLYPVLASRQRVIAIDWAQVHPDRPLELDDLVGQVAETIRRLLPGRRVVLLGYSLGAVVTAKLSADHPELVERLILVSGWARTDLQQILRNDVWQALRRSGNDQALREYSTFCAFGGPFLSGRTREDMQPGMDAMDFNSFGDQQMELNRRIDITTEVETITRDLLHPRPDGADPPPARPLRCHRELPLRGDPHRTRRGLRATQRAEPPHPAVPGCPGAVRRRHDHPDPEALSRTPKVSRNIS